MSVLIRPARADDLDSVRKALLDAGLPVEDLSVEHLRFVAEDAGRVVGVVGLEPFAAIGLLRSLVVLAEARSGGVGRQLVAALEAEVRDQGLNELWLLTIDADRYFLGLGYSVRDRADTPTEIQGTAEFSQLCPGDAVLMSKVL